MKKIISLVLLFVSISLSLTTLNSCASSDLSKKYDSYDALIGMLEEEYSGSKEQLETISKNSSICNFFQENYSNRKTFLKALCDSELFEHEIYDLYAACNESTWYNMLILDDGSPLGLYGTDGRPTLKRIAKGIKNSFKDPESVSVTEADIRWKQQDEGSEILNSREFMVVATVRATNSFGAYITNQYMIKSTMSASGLFSYSVYLEVDNDTQAMAYCVSLGYVFLGTPITIEDLDF